MGNVNATLSSAKTGEHFMAKDTLQQYLSESEQRLLQAIAVVDDANK